MRANGRHFGLDWLRIAAFALLILYHVAMVFAPWDWVIKAPVTHDALVAPMAVLTPWRLPLLFAVSGYASRNLFARGEDAGAFARSRCVRLLVPLGFALIALLPPELWVRARLAGYQGGLGRWWLVDYWAPGTPFGFGRWVHLWFVVYLWAYTMLLALALRLAGERAAGRVQRRVEWLAGGTRLVWAPIVALIAAKLALMFVAPETQELLRDWGGHAEYLPLFLFGFALGGSAVLWQAVARAARPLAIVAAGAGVVVVWVELSWPGHAVPPHAIMALDRAARLAMAWGVVVALFHLAESRLDRDGAWRTTLGEAVFPFYLVHEPALVLLAYATLPLGLPAPVEFLLLAAGTALACAATYRVGREIAWLRPLIGLAPRRTRASVLEQAPA